MTTNPKYPVYIISKGRWDSRMTSKSLERMKVPYYIAVEPQEYENYAAVIDPKKILTLPFSNHGKGSWPARNWCWEHAIESGAERHWILDDNISDFYRLHENQRIRVESGVIFKAAEDFVDRFENVLVSGFQYRFFIAPNQKYPPFIKNTRIFSCLLIDNKGPYRWRCKYNEDVDLSLQVLKGGYCTIQFNAFLQGKAATQSVKGGNTTELYGKGTLDKSKMIVDLHPDVARLVWRYGRWHHHVDFSKFRDNKLIYKKDIEIPQGVNNYGMKLVNNWKG